MVNPVLVPYKDEYEDELSNLLVEAYMVLISINLL
jgi:hypothetical protein